MGLSLMRAACPVGAGQAAFFLLKFVTVCGILLSRKNLIFQRVADTSGRRLFVLHSSTERR